MNMKNQKEKWTYFGIEVELLECLDNCSLISYQGRELIVDTADLVSKRTLAQAA
jgi:hypothetical protein